MAPAYYRMYECAGCRARHVVLDSFKFVGFSYPDPPPGSGYLLVTEPGTCEKRCSQPMVEIGHIYDLDSGEMTLPLRSQSLHDPAKRMKLTSVQVDEWRQLIEAAGLTHTLEFHEAPTKSWWRFW